MGEDKHKNRVVDGVGWGTKRQNTTNQIKLISQRKKSKIKATKKEKKRKGSFYHIYYGTSKVTLNRMIYCRDAEYGSIKVWQ